MVPTPFLSLFQNYRRAILFIGLLRHRFPARFRCDSGVRGSEACRRADAYRPAGFRVSKLQGQPADGNAACK